MYDARFYVVADRYDYPGTNRTMEVSCPCCPYASDTIKCTGHEGAILQRMS
jgi:hypothetical protein